MQQCSNCKCQVGSGISICPYCGAQLPVEEYKTPERGGTYIRTPNTAQRGGTYRVTYIAATPSEGRSQESPLSIELPAPYDTPYFFYYPERERHTWSRETILLTLLVCVIVASLFEFVALLLLLLR